MSFFLSEMRREPMILAYVMQLAFFDTTWNDTIHCAPGCQSICNSAICLWSFICRDSNVAVLTDIWCCLYYWNYSSHNALGEVNRKCNVAMKWVSWLCATTWACYRRIIISVCSDLTEWLLHELHPLTEWAIQSAAKLQQVTSWLVWVNFIYLHTAGL